MERDGRATTGSLVQGAAASNDGGDLVLDFGRRLQILDHLATGFARHPHHKIPYEDFSEDMAGKAVPEVVIAQLVSAWHCASVGAARTMLPVLVAFGPL